MPCACARTVRCTHLYLVFRSFGAAPQRQGRIVLRTVTLGSNGPGLRDQGAADGRMEGSGPAIQQKHTSRHAEREGPHLRIRSLRGFLSRHFWETVLEVQAVHKRRVIVG